MGIILRQVEQVTCLQAYESNFDKTKHTGRVPDTSSCWTRYPGESHCKSQSEMTPGWVGKKIREAVNIIYPVATLQNFAKGPSIYLKGPQICGLA